LEWRVDFTFEGCAHAIGGAAMACLEGYGSPSDAIGREGLINIEGVVFEFKR
jgi:hypothetical protein